MTAINRGDLFWIAPDDSRGPAPSYSHPHVVVQRIGSLAQTRVDQILAGLRFQQTSFFRDYSALHLD